MGSREMRIAGHAVTETDLVRMVIIASLTASCTIVTFLAFSHLPDLISYQLFFIPILYATYFYARKGLVVAGICGVLSIVIGFYYRFPDPAALIGVTLESLVFVIVASLMSYSIDRIRAGEAQYRTVFEHSQLGIVLLDRTDMRVRQANQKFAAILHLTPGELQSRSFPAFFADASEKDRFFERLENNGKFQDFETRLGTKEGDVCWVTLSWSAMDDRMISVSAVDIDARKRIEKANQDTLLKYRELTENAPTGILIVQEGMVLFANPSFFQFSLYPESEVIGKEFLSFVDPRDHETFNVFMRQFESSIPIAVREEFRFVTRSGESRAGVLFANPILHHGRPATMINLLDISVQQRLEEKIHQDNERRRGIIITVAHELRTPLQPILGYLNLLIQDAEGFGILEDAKKMLERCLVSVERERQIINQMLDLSVLESGKLQLNYSRFSLFTLVNSVLDAGGYSAKAEITIEIPADLTVPADMDRLFSVLDSLLANAVNYSKPPRKIRLSYRLINTTTHAISVQDNGVGIAPGMFDSIFEPFQLADAVKLSRKYNRLGLSLSIAKKIIQMHHGDITVESTLNRGSTFTIHLPLERPNDR